MFKPQNLVTGLILVLLGFGLGWLFARDARAPDSAGQTQPLAPLTQPYDPPEEGAAPSGTRPDAAAYELAVSESRAALDGVLDRRDAFERLAALAELLGGFGEAGVPAVTALMKDPAARLTGAEIELLIRYWARYEPQAATRWASQAPPAYQALAIGPAVEAWAAVDPEAAAEAALSATIYQGTANQVAQRSLVRGWFASGKPGLLEFIRGFGDTIEAQRALSVFSRALIDQQGTRGSIDWVRSLPDDDPKFKLAAHRQLSTELAMADVAVAVGFCEAVCDGPYGGGVRKRIAQYWASQDGLATMAWLSEARPGQDRDLAIRVAFDEWSKADQDSAFGWLTDRGIEGVEPWMHPAIPIYARLRSFTSPPDALRWAALIPSEVEMQIVTVRIARRWRQQDETAAEAWLMVSDLSEELREAARTTEVHAHIPVGPNT